MDREGKKFTIDDPIHPFYICKTIENDMGCKKLGSGIH